MRPKIYLFGDSITEESFGDGGWGASLANHFSRTVDVVLRGYSGYNTRWALKVVDRVFPTAESTGAGAPLAVTVFFGANDVCLPDRYGAFQHVPLNEYKRNLHSIVASLKKAWSMVSLKHFGWESGSPNIQKARDEVWKRWPSTLILLISPPPIDEVQRIGHPYVENPLGLPERTNEAAGAFAKACVETAGECGISVVDLWTRMQHYPDWRNAFLRDGLHLTQEGNKVVFEEVMKKLNEGGLSLNNLTVDLPILSDIDHADPLKAFQQ